MKRKILCVDLGSSFTKIAVRRELDGESLLVEDTKKEVDQGIIYPTVVIRARPPGREERWLTGWDAFEFSTPITEGVDIFSNWKVFFFEEEFDFDLATCVAGQFFTGLKSYLASLQPKDGLIKIPVRLCIPKFSNSKERGKILADTCKDAGFRLEVENPLISEPYSNTLGLLTRGINATWHPKKPGNSRLKKSQPEPNYRQMLDHSNYSKAWFNAVRNALVVGSEVERFHTVLILDIGSFTLDVGVAIFELGGTIEELERPKIYQSSFKLGVRELDDLVKDSCFDKDVQEALKFVSPADWERYKTLLYQRKDLIISTDTAPMIKIENETHQKVSHCINEFGNKVADKTFEFINQQNLSVNQVFLSGGGSAIQSLKKIVLNRLADGGIVNLVDLLDPNEPLPNFNEIRTARGFVRNEAAIEKRRLQNRKLNRGGSAIGGCSLLAEFANFD